MHNFQGCVYCLILNYQGSFACCLKQLSYYIKLILSCQQLFKSFFRLFKAYFALFKQLRYNTINSTSCQLQFKLSLSYSDVWIKSPAKAVYLLYFFVFLKSSDFLKKYKNLGWKVYFHNPYAKVAFSLTHISTFTIVAFSSTIQIRQLPER